MKKSNRQLGMEYEEIAARYLEDKGVQIIARNYRCRLGEIDMIGNHKEYLIFFEVKYRGSLLHGYSAEAVGYHKQKNICRVADIYRYQNKKYDNQNIRYDVIAIDGISVCDTKIQWYQNAFDHHFIR